jgi:peroxiredoxin
MKKVSLIFATALLTIACNNLKDKEFKVEGEAPGVENGKKVYINLQTETGVLAKDTAVVTDGKFILNGTTEDIDLAFISIENEPFNLPIILEAGAIEIKIIKDSVQNSTLGGTLNNEKFQKFNEGSKPITKKVIQFEKANHKKMQKAQMTNDTITINSIRKEYEKFQNEMNTYSERFIKDNTDSFISVLLIENFLMRQHLTNEAIQKLYDSLDKSLLKTKSAKNIKKILETSATIKIGDKAPDFAAPSPNGKKISLMESLGKVTIVDFWASWCGPCRSENPNIVALYKEFHDKGLNIIGVSLDKDAAKWKEAIAKDGLTWNQISNLKHWQEPIAKQYNVSAIPATFILDQNGKIVAKDLRSDALKAKVKELLELK